MKNITVAWSEILSGTMVVHTLPPHGVDTWEIKSHRMPSYSYTVRPNVPRAKDQGLYDNSSLSLQVNVHENNK